MSGGKEKKNKLTKVQGWEEAGSEFYQECYPGDLENLQRDPLKLATLLPSKQNRTTTTKRGSRGSLQYISNKGTRVQANSANAVPTTIRTTTATVTRRGSQCQEVQVAMLPDLSENLTDEERTWDEIREIKAMPVSMTQKKELKAQLQNATKLRLQGLDQFKWQRRKFWQRFKKKWSAWIAKMELWKNALKKIEGHFGTGVVAFFILIRWLAFLNLSMFILICVFIILPQVIYKEKPDFPCDRLPSNSPECCTEKYLNESDQKFSILDIIQGTGIMERTLLFYGNYTNQIFGNDAVNATGAEFTSKETKYDLPLAYISTTVIYYLIVLIAIVRSAAKEFKDRLVEGEGQFYQYCNLIFGGWDFCIDNEKSADIKHKALYNEIKALLHQKRLDFERNNRSREMMLKLIVVRFIVNLIVFLILGICALIIYLLFNLSLRKLEEKPNGLVGDPKKETNIETLFWEFLPYIGIVLFNLLVPLIFNYLIKFEEYSPVFAIKVSLLRTVFLRLSSLVVLLSRFYHLISKNFQTDECLKGTLACWETFVGAQFYKLFLTDFATHCFVTFLVNFPRALIARHFNSKFAKFIGEQEFELSKHVLDIVYSQTLCWLGTFYAPIIPLIAALLNFFMFYVKKFACLNNSKPSAILYRASRSNSLFMFILLLSYAIALVPVVYAIAEIMPSRGCGPFRGYSSVWQTAIERFEKMPDFIKNIIFFVGTASFAVPFFITLVLFLYYYYAVSAANRKYVRLLKNQLILEGHDKQFLLNRLSTFIKQQQEYQKRLRQLESQNNPCNEKHKHNNPNN